MQSPTKHTLKLPHVISLTPFHWDGCNTLYSASKRESTEWMLSFDLLHGYDRERLISTNPELLGAYIYPYANARNLRIAGDAAAIFYAMDAVTDAQDAEEAKTTRDIFVKAITGHSGDDNSPITLFVKDFLRRFPEESGELRERFVKHFVEYIDATAMEARLRCDGIIPDSDEHFNIRRKGGGTYVMFDFVEVALGITLPREVLVDNDFQTIRDAANDMITIANDIYSYVDEYETQGEATNFVAVLRHHSGLSHQEAMDEAADIYKSRAETLLARKTAIRSFGQTVDEMVRAYVHGLEQWITGHNAFNLATRRFYGEETEEVNRTGVVMLKLRTSSV